MLTCEVVFIMGQNKIPLIVYPKLIHIAGFDFRVITYENISNVQACLLALNFYRSCSVSSRGQGEVIDVLDYNNIACGENLLSQSESSKCT